MNGFCKWFQIVLYFKELLQFKLIIEIIEVSLKRGNCDLIWVLCLNLKTLLKRIGNWIKKMFLIGFFMWKTLIVSRLLVSTIVNCSGF